MNRDGIHIVQADARAIPLADGCVQCVVTSPPYWGLRKYAGEQGAEPYGLEPTIQRYLETTREKRDRENQQPGLFQVGISYGFRA